MLVCTGVKMFVFIHNVLPVSMRLLSKHREKNGAYPKQRKDLSQQFCGSWKFPLLPYIVIVFRNTRTSMKPVVAALFSDCFS